ncbi:FkbM family methyltransferase [Rhodospirillum sp. A1_3_36]|uniref:FkbM family methyltransferase n=1 Tax=Rhodospirillum sp. A1_3_36 TaxID=3391666 RepID=UPI0039A5EFCE
MSVKNLGLFCSFLIILNKAIPGVSGNEVVLKTKKFGNVHWRTRDDWVIVHLYCPQVEIYSPGSKIDIRVVVDLGANIGLETMRFKKMYPDARIVAVEAEGANYTQLVKNTKDLCDVTAVQAAIWSSDAHLKLVSGSSDSQAFNLIESEVGESAFDMRGRSLVSILDEQGLAEVDILKIDIEGAESELFGDGCDVWLGRIKCFIIECPDHDAPLTVQKIFKAFDRNGIAVNLYLHGENLVIVKSDLDWACRSIVRY